MAEVNHACFARGAETCTMFSPYFRMQEEVDALSVAAASEMAIQSLACAHVLFFGRLSGIGGAAAGPGRGGNPERDPQVQL